MKNIPNCAAAPEDHQLRIGEQRTEIDHRADTDEQYQREKLIGDTGVKQDGQRAALRDTVHELIDRAGQRQIHENRAEADRQKKRRLHILFDREIYEHPADYPHDRLLPAEIFDDIPI